MAFNLDRKPQYIHHEIKTGVMIIGDDDCPIMAKFRLLPTNKEVDDFIVRLRTIKDSFEANEGYRLNEELAAIAATVFVGWVNPPGREDLWVCNGLEPIEPTTDLVAQYLGIPGVAMVLCDQFVEAIVGGQAALGNSEPSPANGCVATLPEAAPT